jgi:hypothetical protein
MKTMNELVRKLKNMKNATQSQYKEAIEKYAYDEVLNDLKEAGIDKDDLIESEFEDLIKEKTKKATINANTALASGGALMLLELLG